MNHISTLMKEILARVDRVQDAMRNAPDWEERIAKEKTA